MAVLFGFKAVFWQAVLACILTAGLLGVASTHLGRWGREQINPSVRQLIQIDDCTHTNNDREGLLCEQQFREIRSDSQKRKSIVRKTAPKGVKDSQQREQTEASREKEPAPNPLDVSSVPPEEIPGHHKHRLWREAHQDGDLPLLPTDRSPDSDTWNNSVAICACMLQENTTDVREWLLYHRSGPLAAHTCCVSRLRGFLGAKYEISSR
jgi:hypothetical protein